MRKLTALALVAFVALASAVVATEPETDCYEWMPLTIVAPFQPLSALLTSLGVPNAEASVPVPQCWHDCLNKAVYFKGAVALGSLMDTIGPTATAVDVHKVFHLPLWDAGEAYYDNANGKVPTPSYATDTAWHVEDDGWVYVAPSDSVNVLTLDGLKLHYTRWVTPPSETLTPVVDHRAREKWLEVCKVDPSTPLCEYFTE